MEASDYLLIVVIVFAAIIMTYDSYMRTHSPSETLARKKRTDPVWKDVGRL